MKTTKYVIRSTFMQIDLSDLVGRRAKYESAQDWLYAQIAEGYDLDFEKSFTSLEEARKTFKRYENAVDKLRYNPYYRIYTGKAYLLQEEIYEIDEDDEDAEEELVEFSTWECACAEIEEEEEED